MIIKSLQKPKNNKFKITMVNSFHWKNFILLKKKSIIKNKQN